MKVIRYSEFNQKGSHQKYYQILEGLDAHYENMVMNNYSKEMMDEGLNDLLGSLGQGFTDRLKNYAAGWLLSQLGLPPDNLFFSELAKNIVEQISFTNISSYFGEGSCKYWADALAKGLLETLEEKAISLILARGIGIDINMGSGILGTTAASIREALTNYLNSTQFVENITSKLEGVICGKGTSFTKIFGGGNISPKILKQAAGESKSSGDNILDILGIK